MAGSVRFTLPDIVRRRAETEGEAGRDWLDRLDDTLAGIEEAWGVAIGSPLPGGSAAFVAEARDEAGTIAILKLPTPYSRLGRHEAAALTATSGKGYVRLLRHDGASGALLLEKLGNSLEGVDLPYRTQVDIMCSTLLEAWRPVPSDAPFTTGADKANGLAATMLQLWQQLGQPASQPVLDRALMYCQDRAAAWRPENAVLAHGDPQPSNILEVPDGGDQWKFIDPDGLAIEPAYDLGVLLRAWNEGLEGRHAHDRARSYARHLTTRTQVPAEAIWQWGFIERVSTGLHLLQIGQHEEGRDYLTVAEAITSTA